MRTLLIAGNWKMNKTSSDATVFIQALKERIANSPTTVEVVVAPPFTALESTRRALGTSPIQLGAQNMCWEDQGAYTGEISAPMLKDLGCRYVILGHSERRALFDEGGNRLQKKLHAALRHGLKPILCIGESLEQRESGLTDQVLTQQLTESLSGLSSDAMGSITIAYEPVWAIGTGKSATVDQATSAHRAIRQVIATLSTSVIAAATRILYGGSVTPQNIAALLSSDQIDGALIGGACLQVDSFATIIHISLATRSPGV